MEYRLFYSYQSDSPKSINEQFVESAINTAIKRIKGAKIKLVKGFRGTSGQKPLADAMLEQSESSDIFIGDVTLTAEFNDHFYKNHWLLNDYKKIKKTGKVKMYPNGNVLIETGYSWAKKDYDRTILVMNEAFGSPEELPIDMGHLRWPITYNLVESYNKVDYDRELNQLVDNLKNAIVGALKTTRTYHRDRFKPFKQHDVWKSSDFDKELIVSDELKIVVSNIRNALSTPGNPQRLLGPNRSGKTRISRELYRKVDITLKRDEESLEKVLYYDLNTSGYGHIQVQLQDIRDLNQDYIVIVDNCSYKTHKSLCDELYGTNVRILTIANTDQTNIDDQGTIRLSDTYSRDIIKIGVGKRFKNPSIISNIVQESGANIEKAITYISSNITDQDIIAPEYSERWKQLLGVELLHEGALNILEELSLFTHIGINNQYMEHSDFIVSNLHEIDIEKYRVLVLKLANRGVIRIVGDFIVLDSFVEELAFQRIGKFTGEQFSDYVLNVSKYNLSNQFGQRLIELNKERQEGLINHLIGDNGLLSDYNFINTSQGSQIIFKISELFPLEIVGILTKGLNQKSIDELKEFKLGRRNIVWCLEKLALIKETSKEAAKLLFKLALSENESIANNATNAFIQIFQVYLSGTIMSLDERFKVLMELKGEYGKSSIILSALNIGLQASNFHGPVKTWGADKKELKSYDQENKGIKLEERNKYQKDIISVLEQIMFSEDELSPICREIIINRFPEQYKLGDSDSIIATINMIIEKEQGLSTDIRHVFEKMVLLKFGLQENKLNAINKLLEENKPVEDLDRLKVLVIEATFKSIDTEHGWKDLAKEEAQALAQEWLDSNNTCWIDNLGALFKGTQNQTFAFGEKLGETSEEDDDFIEKIVETLNNIPLEEQNIAFIVGYIVGKKDEVFTRKVIESFLNENTLKFHAFRLTHFLQAQVDDIQKLLPVLNTNPTFIIELEYTKLNHLKDENIIEIVDMISEVPEFGNAFALELLWEVFRNEDRWDGLKDTIKPRLLEEGVLRNKTLLGSMLHIEDLIKRLISDGLEQEEIAFFVNEILTDYSEFNVNNETILNILLLHMLEVEFDIVWPLIGTKLLDTNYYVNQDLKRILQFFKFDNDKLLAWCDANSPLGAIKMIGIIPLEDKSENGDITWTEQVNQLIDSFGDNDDFLSALSSRMRNYTVMGSAVPIYETRKKLMQILLNHEKIKVQTFAKEQIEMIKIYIAREQNFDKNYELGEI